MYAAVGRGILDEIGYNADRNDQFLLAGHNSICQKGFPGERYSARSGYHRGSYQDSPGFSRGRFYDGETKIGKYTVFQEVKAGTHHANRSTYTQILKDQAMLREVRDAKVVWTFCGVGGYNNLPASLSRRLKEARSQSGGRFIVEFIGHAR